MTGEQKTEPKASEGESLLAAGSWLCSGAGLGLFGLGLWGFFAAEPPSAALLVSLIVFGFMGVALGWFSLQRKRLAWSFALSLNGTLAVLFLFSGPRIRELIGSNLVVAEIPAMVFATITILLVLSAGEFERRD